MNSPRILRPQGSGRFVLLCDHASNHIPAELHNLGLSATDLARHIAWDIGAAGVTEILSAQLNSPAVLCGVSRLVIDCNRQLDSPELIPEISAGIPVPGNVALSSELKEARVERWFRPYHDAVEVLLRERTERRSESILVAIHSMSPSLGGKARPWQIALSSHTDRRLTDPVLAALRGAGSAVVGDNEPYCIDPLIDYSVPCHAWRRGLRHLQVEFRQDEIADARLQRRWALRFADVLTECA